MLIAAACFIAGTDMSASTSFRYDVRNDRGGHVVEYALRVKQIRQAGQQVRFMGRCDSACTLLLALPASHACVNQNAVFGFHLPYGSTAEHNRSIAQFMLGSYPTWVRDWIESKGGLSSRLKTMRYEYARQYLPDCAEA